MKTVPNTYIEMEVVAAYYAGYLCALALSRDGYEDELLVTHVLRKIIECDRDATINCLNAFSEEMRPEDRLVLGETIENLQVLVQTTTFGMAPLELLSEMAINFNSLLSDLKKIRARGF